MKKGHGFLLAGTAGMLAFAGARCYSHNGPADRLPTITANTQTQAPKPPSIRGVSPIANSVGVQAQTGITVDDIPRSTFSTLANELTDVERVEVFAGPQATLSGRKAISPAINIRGQLGSIHQH